MNLSFNLPIVSKIKSTPLDIRFFKITEYQKVNIFSVIFYPIKIDLQRSQIRFEIVDFHYQTSPLLFFVHTSTNKNPLSAPKTINTSLWFPPSKLITWDSSLVIPITKTSTVINRKLPQRQVIKKRTSINHLRA